VVGGVRTQRHSCEVMAQNMRSDNSPSRDLYCGRGTANALSEDRCPSTSSVVSLARAGASPLPAKIPANGAEQQTEYSLPAWDIGFLSQ
jgi:hypothetical protein